MTRLRLALVIHNHQPCGNLERVFRESFERSYRPLVETLIESGLKINVHYSGALLEWFEANEPEILTQISTLVARDQVELLGGSMYEAILPAIPRGDALGQIRYHAATLERLFAVRPQGMWLAERVWEPGLPSLLDEAGMAYTVLDDAHFVASGLTKEVLTGHFVTEDAGRVLRVFAMQSEFRAMAPYRSPAEVLAWLRHFAEANRGKAHPPSVVLADDGEKFIKNKGFWLADFFALCAQESDWLEVTTLGELIKEPARGTVYLTTGAYRELEMASLEPERARRLEHLCQKLPEDQDLLRGGFWRHILLRYPEVNHLHKRAAYLSRKLQDAARVGEAAMLHLWRAQTSGPYLHVASGGSYLNFLRSSAYRNLIEAENLIEPRKYSWLEVSYLDVDADGEEEVVAESHTMNLYFKPARGGMLIELDYRPSAFNVLDTFSRRPEAYHGPEAGLVYDSYERRALIDHFIGAETTLEEFYTNRYLELGDFVDGRFEASKYRNRVTMGRLGAVRGPVGEPVPVELKKAVRVLPKQGALEVEYRITNHGTVDLITRFGSEWGLAFLAGDAPDRHYLLNGLEAGSLVTVGESRAVRQAGIRDRWLGIEIEFNFARDVLLWRHPIHTHVRGASAAQENLEELYQSSVLLPLWDLDLPAGRSRRVGYTVTIRPC